MAGLVRANWAFGQEMRFLRLVSRMTRNFNRKIFVSANKPSFIMISICL